MKEDLSKARTDELRQLHHTQFEKAMKWLGAGALPAMLGVLGLVTSTRREATPAPLVWLFAACFLAGACVIIIGAWKYKRFRMYKAAFDRQCKLF